MDQAVADPAAPPADINRLTIDGVEYEIPALDVGYELLAEEIDQHWALQKHNPMEALVLGLEGLSATKSIGLREKAEQLLTAEAFRDLRQSKTPWPDPQEVAAWLGTLDGMAWLTWRALVEKHPNLKPDQVRSSIVKKRTQQFKEKQEA